MSILSALMSALSFSSCGIGALRCFLRFCLGLLLQVLHLHINHDIQHFSLFFCK